MSSHRFAGEVVDPYGLHWAVCSCGHREHVKDGENAYTALDRHRAKRRGTSHRRRPK